MRLLLLHNHYGSASPSGENVAFEAELAMLRRHGHEVETLERDSDSLRAAGWGGAVRGALATPWAFAALAAARRLIARFRPDVMHVHNTFPLLSPAVLRAARGTGTATVMTLHNYRTVCAAAIPTRAGRICTLCLDRRSVLPALRYRCYRGSLAATAPLAAMIELHRHLGTWRNDVDRFAALTGFHRDRLAGAGLPGGRIEVKPHFYASPPNPVPWPERNDVAVFLGRLSAEKGAAFAVEAWCWRTPLVPRLDIVGDGPARGAIAERVASAGSGSRVRLLGQMPFAAAQEILARAKLLVMPSTCFEAFPMALREAYALGVPVLASRLGSLVELVEDGATGVLVEAGSAAALHAAVEGLWSEPGRLEAMGRQARVKFEREYTEEHNHEMLVGIYDRAIAHRRGKQAL